MYTFNTSFLLLTLSVALSGVQSHVTRHRHRTSPPVCHEDKELRALERFPDFADEFCPEFLAKTGKYPLWLDHWDKKKVSSACSCYEKTATSSGAPSTVPATGTLSLSSSAPAAVSSVFATTTASSGFFPTASASGGLFPTASASGGYFPSGYTSGGYYPSGSVFASGSSMPSVPNRGVSPLTSCTTSALVSTSAPTIAASSSPSLSISNGSSTVASSTTPSGTSSLPPGDNYPPQPPGEGPGKRGLVYNSLTQNGWSALFNDSKYATYGSNGGWDRGTQLDESFHFVPTLVVDSDLNNAEWNTAVPVLIEGGTKAIFASSETSSNTNLTASQAATVHQKYLQPYAGTVQLGTPCITNDAGDLTLPYLESFLAACTTCTFNFVDVRFYQDRTAATPVQYAQAVRDFLENDIVAVQAKYPQVKGLPVFVSGWWLNGVTLSEGGDLMELLLPYLDNNPNVLAHQSSAGLLEGGLVNAEATGLTPAGQAYDTYFADVASFQG